MEQRSACCFSCDWTRPHPDHAASTVGALGVSVAVTSGSHLFVKDLAPFKLLFPVSGPILYTKLSCHWCRQMTSIIVYSLRSEDGIQYVLMERTVLSSCTTALSKHTPCYQNVLLLDDLYADTWYTHAAKEKMAASDWCCKMSNQKTYMYCTVYVIHTLYIVFKTTAVAVQRYLLHLNQEDFSHFCFLIGKFWSILI